MRKFAVYSGVWTQYSIEDRIAAIAQVGFDAICLDFEQELFATETAWENQVRLAEKYRLPIENVHLTGMGMNAVWQEGAEGDAVITRLIDELHRMASLGIRIGIAHVTWGHDRPADCLSLALHRFSRAVEAAEREGVILALENSVFADRVHYLLSHLQSDALGFCYDSGHEHAFTPNEDYLNDYKSRLVALHLHDNDGKHDNHYPPFHPCGTIDWEKKVSTLKETALFSRMITLEAVPVGDSLADGFAQLLTAAKRLDAL